TSALRARATQILASDTLGEMEDRVRELQEQVDTEHAARAKAEKDAVESRSGLTAFAILLRDLWKQVGSAVGLWTVYFTVLTTRLKGQTVGKRLMRVRVLRLDGTSIGWWSAFERAGGYVAGIATGFLGFAQILWDPNRQCIHDKIVGTVVVIDGAQRVAWEEAAWGGRTRS
ncbi:MAG TPA: RDD family protein, partial [Acidimicrobiales bacterium]|nr:RDD family protein [Acidimicrobiales bacterium]